jgi:anaerobic selenocysteine-containing dehydrogenase
LVTGKTAIILPTLGRSEADEIDGKLRFVTVENSMGKVHRSQGKSKPASAKLKSEPTIVAGIAAAYFNNLGPVEWEKLGSDYELIREKIALVINGFKDYSKRSAESGFYLPNNAREGDFSELPGGKAQLSICELADHQLEDGDFILMSIRSHDQFNTTIYGLDDRYRGVFNERRVVFMNEQDMKDHGLQDRSIVDLVSHYDGQERRAEKFKVITYKIPKGNLAAYFPETNMLVPINHFAAKSNTPISKSIKVRLEKRDKGQ